MRQGCGKQPLQKRQPRRGRLKQQPRLLQKRLERCRKQRTLKRLPRWRLARMLRRRRLRVSSMRKVAWLVFVYLLSLFGTFWGLGSQTEVAQTMPMFFKPAAGPAAGHTACPAAGAAAAPAAVSAAAPPEDAAAADAAWQEDFEREMILRLPALVMGEFDDMEESQIPPTQPDVEPADIPPTQLPEASDVPPSIPEASDVPPTIPDPSDVPPTIPDASVVPSMDAKVEEPPAASDGSGLGTPQDTADKKVALEPNFYRGSFDYLLQTRGLHPSQKVPQLEAALDAQREGLVQDAGGMDERDVRAEQLGMRASEVAKSKELKEQKKMEKEAAKEAAKLEPPKPRGRPRKSQAQPEAADTEAAAEPVAKRRRKKESQVDAEVAEPAEAAEPAPKRRKSGQAVEPKAKAKGKAKAAEKVEAGNEEPQEQQPVAVPKAKAAPKQRSKKHACINVQQAPVDAQVQAEMLELCSKFDNVVYDRTKEALHKFSGVEWVRIDAYWSRQAIGVKIYYQDAWAQKWYFSLRSLPFCLNIYMAQKMAIEVAKHEKDWHDSEECRNFEAMLRATAVAADAAYQESRCMPAA